MVKCIRVERKKAEEGRRKLCDGGHLDTGYKPASSGDYVYFAVRKKPSGYMVFEKKMRKISFKPHSLHEALEGKLSAKEIDEVVRSFDVLGDLAIVEIPPKLVRKQKLVAEALMRIHPNVKTVAKKMGPMEGEFRVRKLKHVFGRPGFETEYRESGCVFRLDPSKVYFSPRLSHERERISGLVKEKEKILALFAGVGPFPIVIANRKPKTQIVAIELNPRAFDYMVENVRLNKTFNITPVLGDVREVVPEIAAGFADRVLMPLPKGAEKFLDVAMLGAKRGAVVHLYTFAKNDDLEEVKKAISEAGKNAGRKTKILLTRRVRPFAPHVDQFVIDFQVC
ncbi:MAG: class I SAM-dependent methyltransferase family protein [Candidatus Micrarchaeota archaeon]|nr:class I SAM-dependent methyltransferase family protein [Candidatus Micrarchaeota archaeon]